MFFIDKHELARRRQLDAVVQVQHRCEFKFELGKQLPLARPFAHQAVGPTRLSAREPVQFRNKVLHPSPIRLYLCACGLFSAESLLLIGLVAKPGGANDEATRFLLPLPAPASSRMRLGQLNTVFQLAKVGDMLARLALDRAHADSPEGPLEDGMTQGREAH